MTLTLNGIFLLQLLVLKNVIPEHMVLIVHFIVGVITSRVIVSQVYVSVIRGIQDNIVNWYVSGEELSPFNCLGKQNVVQ